ncbi:MAG TPA: zincin-like metallopeptidase domain-containing protein [Tepidisphaeraceae bacterium]|nr:zincin-like metallopeptidase domain-containing protein [Tepidisphaeraceae bacterium]
MSFDLYQSVTDQIVAMLEAGVVPWRSPILGRSKAGHPKNLNTGKQYRGVNVFLLAFTAYAKGYGSSYWLTFNQARERGGNVRKGEKSSMVVFWKQYETTDKETGEAVRVPVLRYYNVFNAEQVDGVETPDAVKYQPLNFRPIEEAERIATGYEGGPVVTHDGGQQAFYRPSTDSVHLPDRTRFATAEEYYSTLFHELSHSTGHSTRLDRKIDSDSKPFGSADYGREELVAEMSAAFLCSHAGIQPAVISNQAAYLAGWLKQLRADKKLVIAAAGRAQRSADWIRGERQQPE